MTYLEHYESPLGPLTLASDGQHLVGLWYDGQKYDRATLTGPSSEEMGLAQVFAQTREWLDIYFSGERPTFTPPLKVEGSAFRQMVCEIMLQIPYGATISYGEIAQQVARRMGKAHMSAQAIGGAVGHNPIGIIIPCHRVMGSKGQLTGYAGGIEKKIWLLQHEHIIF